MLSRGTDLVSRARRVSLCCELIRGLLYEEKTAAIISDTVTMATARSWHNNWGVWCPVKARLVDYVLRLYGHSRAQNN